VTADERGAGGQPPEKAQTGTTTVAKTDTQVALERYGRRMRRSRAIYFAVIAVVVLALGITVGIAWSHGEAAHTSLHSAPSPAPSVALRVPSPTLRQLWRNGERTAIGTPYWGGTVVSSTADSVRGRDAATGRLTWSYTRTDRTVCQAIQVLGVTLAVFELHGNCDQVTALDSGTGERRWTRTLDKDGHPLDGHPSYSLTQFTVVFTTPSVSYAIDPNSGLDRWVYQPPGCTIRGAVIGAAGALISQSCTKPNCTGLKFCGAGAQLLLRDASLGRSDDAKDSANPDRIKWDLIGTSAVPASADKVIAAVDPAAGELRLFDEAKGTPLESVALQGTPITAEGIAALATDRAELFWISGTTYSIALTGALLWTAPTQTPPTVTLLSGTQGSTPDLSQSSISVAGPSGIELLDPGSGTTIRTFTLTPPPRATLVYPFGSGFVLCGAATTVYR
jgi:PQQ-like domain